MAEKEQSITPGQEVFAVDTRSNRLVVLTVKVVAEDGRVVLSPNRKRTVIASPETIINGGIAEQFRFSPQDIDKTLGKA